MSTHQPFTVVPTPAFRRNLQRLALFYGEAAYAAVLELAQGDLADRPGAGRKLRGRLTGRRRMARGDYRVVYRVDEGKRTVYLLQADHRRDVYR